MSKKEILDFINDYLYVDSKASKLIYEYFYEQYKYEEIPHNKKILVEHYDDGSRKHVFFHSLYGRRVNDCLSRAIAFSITRLQKKSVEIGINDNGFANIKRKRHQC